MGKDAQNSAAAISIWCLLKKSCPSLIFSVSTQIGEVDLHQVASEDPVRLAVEDELVREVLRILCEVLDGLDQLGVERITLPAELVEITVV